MFSCDEITNKINDMFAFKAIGAKNMEKSDKLLAHLEYRNDFCIGLC